MQILLKLKIQFIVQKNQKIILLHLNTKHDYINIINILLNLRNNFIYLKM